MYDLKDIEQVTYDFPTKTMTVKLNKKIYWKKYLKSEFNYKVSFETYKEKVIKFIKYKTNTSTHACHIRNVPCVKFCESKENYKCSLYLKNI